MTEPTSPAKNFGILPRNSRMIEALRRIKVLRRCKRFVTDFCFLAKYATPAIFPKRVCQSREIKLLVNEFKQKGIIKLESDDFVKIAEYLDSFYFKKIEANNNTVNQEDFIDNDRKFFIKEFHKEKNESSGMEISAYISFMDKNIASLLLNEKIHSILYSYYGRQHYFRNQPRIIKTNYKGKSINENSNMHVDHLHQVTIILNVSDITMDDTHTVYVPNSNRRPLLKQGIEIPIEKCKEFVKAYDQRYSLVGKKGTLYIFNTSGFHRGNYFEGVPRKILHLNITTGHNLNVLWDDPKDLSAWKEKNEKEVYIRKAFDKAMLV